MVPLSCLFINIINTNIQGHYIRCSYITVHTFSISCIFSSRGEIWVHDGVVMLAGLVKSLGSYALLLFLDMGAALILVWGS